MQNRTAFRPEGSEPALNLRVRNSTGDSTCLFKKVSKVESSSEGKQFWEACCARIAYGMLGFYASVRGERLMEASNDEGDKVILSDPRSFSSNVLRGL